MSKRTCFACDRTDHLTPVTGGGKRVLACRAHVGLAVKAVAVCGDPIGKNDDADTSYRAPVRTKRRAARRAARTRADGRSSASRGKPTPAKAVVAAAMLVEEVLRVQESRRAPLPEGVADAVQTLQGAAYMLKHRRLDGAGLEAFNRAAAETAAWLNGNDG